jgi:hypothetical protein
MTHHASCACGAIRLEAQGAPVLQCYCHCNKCRSMTGGPVNAVALWPRDAVRVVAGEDSLRRWSQADSRAERLSCAGCGGAVGADLPAIGMFDIFAGLVEDLTFEPTHHLNYGNAVLRIADGLPKFEDMPERAGGSGQMLPE